MKILWITNILFPDICDKLGIKQTVLGGWMYSSAIKLNNNINIEVAVASVYKGSKFESHLINGIQYYVLPNNKNIDEYNNSLEKFWFEIKNDFKPDIVHIHGTELTHGLSYINSCGNKNVVISIQGLVSVIERYYYSGIDISEIVSNLTIRNILRRDGIINQKNNFKKRGFFEKEYIENIKYCIGRTTWDKLHVTTINPNINYFHCDEILRDEFYEGQWEIGKCIKQSLFVSQASYPIKGLHQVIKALNIVTKSYPNTKLYIAGKNYTLNSSLWEKLTFTGYGKYISKLIKKYNLSNNIVFTGELDSVKMKQQYLKSHIFICSSSIENSPNSLGEAQILGVPCIATRVGGIPDMVIENKTTLMYRFEEYEELAQKIIELFNNNNLCNDLSRASIIIAKKRHNWVDNTSNLLKIYNLIQMNNIQNE